MRHINLIVQFDGNQQSINEHHWSKVIIFTKTLDLILFSKTSTRSLQDYLSAKNIGIDEI